MDFPPENPVALLGGDDTGVKQKQDCSIGERNKGNNFARLAWEYQRDGYHFEAIDFYTKAIFLVPDDHRYYVNRSASYEAVSHYSLALADAEKSIELDESKPKGHFRKGRCLRLLNKLTEAESCFKHVLLMKPGCEDTIEELDIIRNLISQAELENRFSSLSTSYDNFPIVSHFKCDVVDQTRQTDRTVSRPNERNSKSRQTTETGVTVNDHNSSKRTLSSGSSFNSLERSKRIVQEKTKKDQLRQVIFDGKFGPDQGPTNLFGYHGVYVGHLDPSARLEDIRNIFSKYGTISHLSFRPEKFCAFVSFNNSKSPREAIQFLNDKEIPCLCVEGKTLKLNFHVAFDQEPKLDTYFEGKIGRGINNECYNWRTTGCNDDECKFRHLKFCRGIDYQSWMRPGPVRDQKSFKSCPFSTSSPGRH